MVCSSNLSITMIAILKIRTTFIFNFGTITCFGSFYNYFFLFRVETTCVFDSYRLVESVLRRTVNFCVLLHERTSNIKLYQ